MRYRVSASTLDKHTPSRRALLQAIEFEIEPGNRTRVSIAGEEVFILPSFQDALVAMSLAQADVEKV